MLGHLIGVLPISGGWLAGVSTLAVVAAFNDTNGGLYMALMEHYGRPEDAGAYCVMALESGPFFTMITLGVAGLSSFPWQTLVGAILPLFVGMALGNLDAEFEIFLGKAAPAMIPFFAFGLGASLDLKRIWEAGLIGFVLGIAVIAISGAVSDCGRPADGWNGRCREWLPRRRRAMLRRCLRWWPRRTTNMLPRQVRRRCWWPPA